MRPGITYSRRRRNPAPLSTAQFQAVATSPYSHRRSEHPLTTSNAHQSISLNIKPPGHLTKNESAAGKLVDYSSPARARNPYLTTQDGPKRMSHRLARFRLRPRSRLFQTKSRRILASGAGGQDAQSNANRSQRTSVRRFEDDSSDTTGVHELDLVVSNIEPSLSNAHTHMQPLVRDDDNTRLSTIEPCDSTSPDMSPGSSLTELRRTLYACTSRDASLRQLRSRKFRRSVISERVQKSARQIGDGFETTERFTRLPVLTVKHRKAAKPRPTYCRPLVLVATSPHDSGMMWQQPAWRTRYLLAGTSKLVSEDRDLDFQSVNSLDQQSLAQEDPQPLDQNIQQLFQSITAPARPETPVTETANTSQASQSSISSRTLSETGSSSSDSGGSWSGLVSSPSQLVFMDEHGPQLLLESRSNLVASPSFSLLSSSDVFESLEGEAFGPQDSCHTAETVSLTRPIVQQPSEGSYISSALHKTSMQIHILDSEGAVLETSQSLD